MYECMNSQGQPVADQPGQQAGQYVLRLGPTAGDWTIQATMTSGTTTVGLLTKMATIRECKPPLGHSALKRRSFNAKIQQRVARAATYALCTVVARMATRGPPFRTAQPLAQPLAQQTYLHLRRERRGISPYGRTRTRKLMCAH